MSHPFPVAIDGPLLDLHWHVIDGRKQPPGGGGSHDDHMKLAIKGNQPKAKGTLVGFFSKQHQGTFTHMGSLTHLHVVLTTEKITGHVDAVPIRKGAILRLPR